MSGFALWLAAITGVPARSAARVYRLLEGYTPRFEWVPFHRAGCFCRVAGAGALAYQPPAARHLAFILPAGGVTMLGHADALWLPALNYARSYETVASRVALTVGMNSSDPACIQQYGLGDGHVTALMYYANLPLT